MFRGERDEDGEDRPAAVRGRAAAHADMAAVLGDDALTDPQAKPGPLFSLCGVERFEDPLRILRRDPGTGVCHHDANARFLRVVELVALISAYPQATAHRTGLQRIGEQVRHYLAKFACKSQDAAREFDLAGDLDTLCHRSPAV